MAGEGGWVKGPSRTLAPQEGNLALLRECELALLLRGLPRTLHLLEQLLLLHVLLLAELELGDLVRQGGCCIATGSPMAAWSDTTGL